MGIYEKHWKRGYNYKLAQGGSKKPIYHPTEFGNTPQSLFRQSVNPSYSRNSESRNALAEERAKSSEKIKQEKDRIKSWDSLIMYCKLLDLNVSSSENHIRLCKLSDDTFPPRIDFSIQIDNSYKVQAYKGSTEIHVSNILKGF